MYYCTYCKRKFSNKASFTKHNKTITHKKKKNKKNKKRKTPKYSIKWMIKNNKKSCKC